MLSRRTLLVGTGVSAMASMLVCVPATTEVMPIARTKALAHVTSGVREFLVHVSQDEYALKHYYMAPWICQYREWSAVEDIEHTIVAKLHHAFADLAQAGIGTKERPLMRDGRMDIHAQFVLTEYIPFIPQMHGHPEFFEALAQLAPNHFV